MRRLVSHPVYGTFPSAYLIILKSSNRIDDRDEVLVLGEESPSLVANVLHRMVEDEAFSQGKSEWFLISPINAFVVRPNSSDILGPMPFTLVEDRITETGEWPEDLLICFEGLDFWITFSETIKALCDHNPGYAEFRRLSRLSLFEGVVGNVLKKQWGNIAEFLFAKGYSSAQSPSKQDAVFRRVYQALPALVRFTLPESKFVEFMMSRSNQIMEKFAAWSYENQMHAAVVERDGLDTTQSK